MRLKHRYIRRSTAVILSSVLLSTGICNLAYADTVIEPAEQEYHEAEKDYDLDSELLSDRVSESREIEMLKSQYNAQGELEYDVEGGKIYIDAKRGYVSRADETVTNVTIPAEVDGVEIIGIDNYVFSRCMNLESVELEEGIRFLGVRCFAETKIEEITIPASVTEIGRDWSGGGRWFENCTNLKKITIADGSQAILESAFARIHSSYVINIPDSVKSIGNFAFGESDIEKVTGDEAEKGKAGVVVLGKNIERYGESIFRSCQKLKSVNIPSHVKETSNYMFMGCSNLEKIELEEGIKKLGTLCFSQTKIEEIVIPASVTETGRDWLGGGRWFENCTNMKRITIADGSQAILESAFARIKSDFIIDIPLSVKRIEKHAFADCPNLTKLNMPPNLEYIGTEAFVNSPKLTIYSPMNYIVLQKVFEDKLKFELQVGNMSMNYGIVDNEESNYNVSEISSSGKIVCKLNYKLKGDLNELADCVIRIRTRDSVDLDRGSVKFNGNLVDNYIYRDNMITIPITENFGSIEFTLSRIEYEELLSYASINYTLNGERKDDLISYIKKDISGISIDEVPVHGSEFRVEGVTIPNKNVRVFLDNKFAGSSVSNSSGNYSVVVSAKASETKEYTLKAITDGINSEAISKTTVNPTQPELESIVLKYPGIGGSNEINLSQAGVKKQTISLANRNPLVYSVKINNDANVDKVYIYGTDVGSNIKRLEAHKSSDGKTWITDGYFDNTNHNYTPSDIRVMYIAKSNAKEGAKTLNNLSNNINAAAFNSGMTTYTNEEDSEKDKYDGVFARYLKGESYEDMKKRAVDDAIEVLNDKLKEKITDEAKEEIAKFINEAVEEGKIDDNLVTKYLGDTELQGEISTIVSYANDLVYVYNTADKYIKQGYLTEKEKRELTMFFIDKASDTTTNFIPILGPSLFVFRTILKETMSLYGFINDEISEALGYADSIAEKKPLFPKIPKFTGPKIHMPKFKLDPSGYVYEAVLSNRLQGATVSIYQWDEISYMPLLWNAIEYGQENKQKTGETGTFGWDVPDGRWQLKCEKDGYESYTGEWLTVPPIHTDIKIPMISTEKPVISDTVRNGKELRVVFSKYMKPETLDGITITDLDGNNISYSMEYSKQEKDANNNIYAKEYIFKISDERDNIPLILNITDKVQSYAGISMDTEQNYIP